MQVVLTHCIHEINIASSHNPFQCTLIEVPVFHITEIVFAGIELVDKHIHLIMPVNRVELTKIVQQELVILSFAERKVFHVDMVSGCNLCIYLGLTLQDIRDT